MVLTISGPLSPTRARRLIGPLPKLRIDTTSLIQLLQNLVANAIRYRSAAPPLISISAQLEGAFWHFYCRDNGVGISPEHYQRIFERFKRLHGQEIPGSGIVWRFAERLLTGMGAGSGWNRLLVKDPRSSSRSQRLTIRVVVRNNSIAISCHVCQIDTRDANRRESVCKSFLRR